MSDCEINDLKHAGNIGAHSTATKNVKNNDLKVISYFSNLKTYDKTEDDVEIAPTSDTPAQAYTQACEEKNHPLSKITACNSAD